MLLNSGIREDSWVSLRLQGDPTSQFQRKSVLNIHWKDWCWSWNSNTLASWEEDWLIGKDPDAGKDWRWEEKGMTDNEMVGWYHQLYGDEFEQALGVGDGQGSLVCCSPWGCKESDMTEQLNWTELNCSLPGSSFHGIFQARILEWVSIPFSRGSSQPRDKTRVLASPALAGGFFTSSATWEAQGSVYLDSKVSAGIRSFPLICLVSSWTSSYLEHVLLVVNGRSAREEARAWQQV